MTTGNSMEEYYIASVECAETRYSDGDVAVKDGTRVWLGEVNGYAACVDDVRKAKRQRDPDIWQLIWQGWNGSPWWAVFKPGSLHVYKVTIVTTETIDPNPVTLRE